MSVGCLSDPILCIYDHFRLCYICHSIDTSCKKLAEAWKAICGGKSKTNWVLAQVTSDEKSVKVEVSARGCVYLSLSVCVCVLRACVCVVCVCVCVCVCVLCFCVNVCVSCCLAQFDESGETGFKGFKDK